MSLKYAVILGLVYTSVASNFFWECEEDTTKRCLTPGATLPEGQFCGTCFEESDKCTICTYFTEDAEANDFTHMFSEYWGAWILSFIAAIAFIATPVICCTFYIGRFACDICGGRYPNYGFAMTPEPGAPLPEGATQTDRVSPNGAPLRPYTESEIMAPRIGLIVVLIAFMFALVCFVITVIEAGNTVDGFFINARAQASSIAISATGVVDSVEEIVKRDGRAFGAARTALVAARNYIFELQALDTNLGTFYDTDGAAIEDLIELSRWLMLAFVIVAIIVVGAGLLASFMKVRDVCPLALTAVMFWIVTISWAGVLCTLGPAWFVGDGCDAISDVITPGDTLAPTTGLISFLNEVAQDPVAGVDVGRLPRGIWSDVCTSMKATCDAGPPSFSCTLLNNCAVPAAPTRAGFTQFMSQSTYTFQGQTPTSFTDCASGLNACNCTQYRDTNLAAYDTCVNTLKPPTDEMAVLRTIMSDVRTAMFAATDATNGPLNTALIQSRAEVIVDDCDSVHLALAWACVGFAVIAIFGCGSTICLVLGAKRNIDAGHVPCYDAPQKAVSVVTNRQQQQQQQQQQQPTYQYEKPLAAKEQPQLVGSSVLAAPRPISGGSGVVELFAGPDGALYAPVDQVQEYGDSQGGGQQYPNAGVVVPEQQDARWALQDDQWPAPQVAF